MAIMIPETGYAPCPRDWIGFGSKCFYLSEHTSDWTSSQTSCMELGAHLTYFDSLEELNFLNRFKGDSAAWIGLHRESSEHPWMWTDNTEYNNLVPTRGEGQHAYLSDREISTGRNNIPRNGRSVLRGKLHKEMAFLRGDSQVKKLNSRETAWATTLGHSSLTSESVTLGEASSVWEAIWIGTVVLTQWSDNCRTKDKTDTAPESPTAKPCLRKLPSPHS
ncbi:hypothetical protein U0070_000962, partial [Myodes glareolus]